MGNFTFFQQLLQQKDWFTLIRWSPSRMLFSFLTMSQFGPSLKRIETMEALN
jgi:hypothetical protein